MLHWQIFLKNDYSKLLNKITVGIVFISNRHILQFGIIDLVNNYI